MPDISTIRHDSIFDYNKALPVTIIGAGATGSRVFASLVELGCTNITIVDFDSVESHNLANQIYRDADVSWTKVAACKHWYQHKIGRSAPPSMRFVDARVPDGFTEMSEVVFLLTDTMASRREIFDACLASNFGVTRVIETRMASSYGDIISFDPCVPADQTQWLASLVDDGDAEVSPCGSSISVGTTASIIANLAVWKYILLCMGVSPLPAPTRTRIYLNPELITNEGKL